jgi:hypothetical protein
MTVFNLFSIIFFILSVVNTILEQRINGMANFFNMSDRHCGFINALCILVSSTLLMFTIIEIVPWDYKVF